MIMFIKFVILFRPFKEVHLTDIPLFLKELS